MSRRVCNEHFKCRKSILYLLEQVPEGPCPDDVSCEFELGKFYAIVGQFGSGKTTLLSMLAWLGDPDEGRVVSEGKAVREIGSERHRREAIPRAQELLAAVGLEDVDPRKSPAMLSGGQQQRVAIARALASEAKVLLADEPTGNLDSENGRNIITLIKYLAGEANRCIIVITHDREIASQADVIYRMRDGRIEREV
ncbi:ABC transporter ATP-binding protein [Acutalibacter muris]|uniref:ABC transporter ATP-binding protein n=1 Tax=Acutalibacter muris TaxID=1796620 RepID=UPI00272C2D68|nr:ABC transporter ATP-binding protein [Acutalibacter muris]